MNERAWLEVRRGSSPLIVNFPHTGVDIPEEICAGLRSRWLARKDADWWVDELYEFVREEFDATTVRTRISRTCIDVNRDPSGASLYPGQATTELCPTSTFDGEALYREGLELEAEEIERRKDVYFRPYHAALGEELERLRRSYSNVVLYDAHSIRSVIPRLFEGTLPELNLGTNRGGSCAAELERKLGGVLSASGFEYVLNGRFKGGWITRHYGRPDAGVHAVQMELACRSYMRELASVSEENWPAVLDVAAADRLREVLRGMLRACVEFALGRASAMEDGFKEMR
jgi:N-formylglutamate deformylase